MQSDSRTPAERPVDAVQPVTVDRPPVDWPRVLANWQEAERRVLAMAQKLAGVKSRAEDHTALIDASVACTAKVRWALECLEHDQKYAAKYAAKVPA